MMAFPNSLGPDQDRQYSLDPDQDRQYVDPDLDQNSSTL